MNSFQKKSDVKISMQESTEFLELLKKKIRVEKCLGEANSTQDMERAEEEKPDEVGREKRDEKP